MEGGGMGSMMPPPTPSMPAGGGGGGGNMMMMPSDMTPMHMTFFWGRRVNILFSGWPGDHGVGMYILALILVFLASALLEFLSYIANRISRSLKDDMRVTRGLALTTLVAVRTGLSYLVMLAVMSFNVGVLIAAVAGYALGYLVFGSRIFKWSDGAQPADGNQSAVLPAKC